MIALSCFSSCGDFLFAGKNLILRRFVIMLATQCLTIQRPLFTFTASVSFNP